MRFIPMRPIQKSLPTPAQTKTLEYPSKPNKPPTPNDCPRRHQRSPQIIECADRKQRPHQLLLPAPIPPSNPPRHLPANRHKLSSLQRQSKGRIFLISNFLLTLSLRSQQSATRDSQSEFAIGKLGWRASLTNSASNPSTITNETSSLESANSHLFTLCSFAIPFPCVIPYIPQFISLASSIPDLVPAKSQQPTPIVDHKASIKTLPQLAILIASSLSPNTRRHNLFPTTARQRKSFPISNFLLTISLRSQQLATRDSQS